MTTVSEGGEPVVAATWHYLTGNEPRTGYATYDLLLGTELTVVMNDIRTANGQIVDLEAELEQLCQQLSPQVLHPCISVSMVSSTEPAIVWNATSPHLADSIALLLSELRAQASARGARSIVITSVPDGAYWEPLRLATANSGYMPALQSPLAVMPVPANGIVGAIERLSRHQRKNCRREMRVFEASVDRISVHGSERLLDDDIVELLGRRYRKYGHQTSRQAVVDRMSRAQRYPNVIVLVAERDGKAAAFKALVADDVNRRLVSRFSACDTNKTFDYFNIVFYEPLKFGARHGFSTLTLGTETYGAKVARGAVLERRSTLVTAVVDTAGLEEATALRTRAEHARLAVTGR